MFSQLAITGFRCFKQLRIDTLSRVNLITGKNNVGKTALLEALFLHCHPHRASVWPSVSKSRGIEEPTEAFEDVASWFFFDRDTSQLVRIESRDASGVGRRTELHLVSRAVCRNDFPEVEANIQSSFRADIAGSDVPRLIVSFKENDQVASTSVAFPSSTGVYSIEAVASFPCTMHTTHDLSLDVDAERFSRLEADNKHEQVVDSLRCLEPKLTKLSVLVFAKKPIIHGQVGLSRLVPIPFMGEGMRRVLSLLLAIGNTPKGTVLIDEIETGVHYSVLPDMWKAVANAARQYDVQILATTHSRECLQAAHESFAAEGEEEYDFRLYRLDRTESGDIEAVTFDRETLETSLDLAWEVR